MSLLFRTKAVGRVVITPAAKPDRTHDLICQDPNK
jgi:hypothetical protein